MSTVFIGIQKIRKIKRIIKKKKSKKVFLVTGNLSYALSGAEKILENVLQGVNITRFTSSGPNPGINDIKKAIKAFNNNECDITIAVGGGTVMDIAKAVSLLAKGENQDITAVIKGTDSINTSQMVPVIAIPTTSGSGSEATHFSVIYIDGLKYSLAHPLMKPKYVFLVPELHLKLNSKIAASSGMDALCQAIESFWSINSTYISRYYSMKALKMLLKSLVPSILSPNIQNKRAVMKAAFYSGKAINIAKTTAAHALSYYFTSRFNISHGRAVALTLPSFIQWNMHIENKTLNDSRGKNHVIGVMMRLKKTLCSDGFENAPEDRVLQIMDKIDIRKNITEYNLDKTEVLAELKDYINLDRLNNNPVRIDMDNISEIIN